MVVEMDKGDVQFNRLEFTDHRVLMRARDSACDRGRAAPLSVYLQAGPEFTS